MRVRKVDVYLNLKPYAVTDAMIEGARAMARWYNAEGNTKKAEDIEMLFLRVDDDKAIGEVSGKLQAYSDRFARLCVA